MLLRIIVDCCSSDSAPGVRGPFLTELTSFLNTFKAIPTPSMIMSYGGLMRSEAADAMWNLINKVPISEHDTAALFYSDFTPIPGAARSHNRYFTPGLRPGAPDDEASSHDARGQHSRQDRVRSRVLVSSDEDDDNFGACHTGGNRRQRTQNRDQSDDASPAARQPAPGNAYGRMHTGESGFARVRAVLATRRTDAPAARTSTQLGDFEHLEDDWHIDSAPAAHSRGPSPVRNIGHGLGARGSNTFILDQAGHSGGDDDDDDEEEAAALDEMRDFIVPDGEGEEEFDAEEMNNASGEDA